MPPPVVKGFLPLQYYPSTVQGRDEQTPRNIVFGTNHVVTVREGERAGQYYLMTSTGVEYQIVVNNLNDLREAWKDVT